MSRNRELAGKLVKLTAFTLVSVVVTVVVVASLLDIKNTPTTAYQAAFTDSSGLQSGDPVRIAGVEVGRVQGVHLVHDDHAVVSFTLDTDQIVTRSTHLQIHYENLLGQRDLTLVADPTGSQQVVDHRQLIPTSLTTPALDLTDLFNGFQPLFTALTPNDINQLTGNIIGAFQGESGNISSLVSEAASLTNNLADRNQVIDQVVNNLTGLLQVVGTHDQQLGQLIDGFSQLTGDLAGERGLVSSALGNTSAMVTSLNNLLGATVGPLQTSITGLDSATGALAGDQTQIDGLLKQLPVTITNVTKIFQSGTFATGYICGLSFTPSGPFAASPSMLVQVLQGLPLLGGALTNLTGNVLELTFPAGAVGNNNTHSKSCQDLQNP